MTSARYECSKCLGRGVIRAFAHIGGGQCFTCKGRGYTDRPQVNPYVRTTAPAPAQPEIAIPGLGVVEVHPYGIAIPDTRTHGSLPVYLDGAGKSVRVHNICTGLAPRRAEIQAALRAWGQYGV